MIWLGVALYVVLGALYSIEGAARIDAWGGKEGDHHWLPHEYCLVAVASLVWPLALLAMLWFWLFEWRAEQIKKRFHAAA